MFSLRLARIMCAGALVALVCSVILFQQAWATSMRMPQSSDSFQRSPSSEFEQPRKRERHRGNRIPGIGGGIIITIPSRQQEPQPEPEFEQPPQRVAECGPGEVFSRNRGACVCRKGLKRIDGICTQAGPPPTEIADCGRGEIFSRNRGQCVCRKGFKRVGGECAPIGEPPVKIAQCGPNELFSSNRGRCVCRKGFDRVGGACVLPEPDEPVRVAECGAGEVFSINRGRCVCRKGLDRVGGKCVTPPEIVVIDPTPEKPQKEEPTIEPVAQEQPEKPVREVQKIANITARDQCLPADLYDMLKQTYGRAPEIDRCDAACLAKPARFSEPELADMSKRFGIEWCESCVKLGGWLPLADIQRIEKLAGVTLCMTDGARLCSAPGYAHIDRGQTTIKIREVIRQFPLTVGKEGDVAVVVGNEAYGDGIIINPNGQSDADAVVTLLTEQLGYKKQNILDLRNASLADLIRVFGGADGIPGELQKLYGGRAKGDIFIYISSHGMRDEASGRSYLLPVDAKADALSTSAYSLDELYANLGKIGARTIMLALEASFGSSLNALVDPPNLPEVEASVLPETPVPGLAVFTASDRDQRPLDDPEYGIGLFTRYLIEGMAGKADASPTGNDDKRLDSVELYVYTANMVRTAARKTLGLEQKPQLSKVDNLLIGRLAAH